MIGLAAAWTKARLSPVSWMNFRRSSCPWYQGSSFLCSSVYRLNILWTGLRRNHYQTASCFPEDHFSGSGRAFYLDGISVHSAGVVPVKTSGSSQALARLILRLWNLSSAATLPVALQCASRAKPLRKDLVNFGIPAFCKYPSLRFRADRSFLLYGCFKDPVRFCSCHGNYGYLLPASWGFCDRCSWCSGRNSYGFPWYYHRCAEI